jgi:hypothetical protein
MSQIERPPFIERLKRVAEYEHQHRPSFTVEEWYLYVQSMRFALDQKYPGQWEAVYETHLKELQRTHPHRNDGSDNHFDSSLETWQYEKAQKLQKDVSKQEWEKYLEKVAIVEVYWFDTQVFKDEHPGSGSVHEIFMAKFNAFFPDTFEPGKAPMFCIPNHPRDFLDYVPGSQRSTNFGRKMEVIGHMVSLVNQARVYTEIK